MRIFNRILLILGIVLFLSCKRETKVIEKEKYKSDFWVDLPDSIEIDSPVRGLIEYKITDSPLKNLKINEKYTFLYATLSDEKILSFEDLKKVSHDTFAIIEKNLIPIYDMKATKKGKTYFQGFLVEQFFYSVSQDSIRIVSKERRFEKGIKVK